MKKPRACSLVVLAILAAVPALAQSQQSLRAPAAPLVVHDPYFSIWSATDKLADDWPRHWTGVIQAMSSMVRVDGKPFRLMGMEPKVVPAAEQVGLQVLPMRTIYDFRAGGVLVRLTFTSPLFTDRLDLVARPVTYLTWQAAAVDGRSHEVSVYFDATAELVVDRPQQKVCWSRPKIDGLAAMRMGSEEQPVLAKSGDNLRIDWGYLYVAAPASPQTKTVIAGHEAARQRFAEGGRLPEADDDRQPRAANDNYPVAACALDFGKVNDKGAKRWLMLAYDDAWSIEYLGQKLRPYWRRHGAEASDLLQMSAIQRDRLEEMCAEFDEKLMAQATKIGGPKYASLCAISYRQVIGAHKLCEGPEGRPMLFGKENFSNGCIATVDVIYPAAPIFALLSNDMLKASVTPVFEYALTPRWKFPFAPHDVGTYPKANGQVYGGGEKTENGQMPVEECGNMLILAALISQIDGNTQYAERYWPLLERWAKYLEAKGLDPENQLCTDDFAGHLAHNANLSLKATVALASYAKMCKMSGRAGEAAAYRRTAEAFAAEWIKLAADGDHYRLAFDKPGTWSQKYNLIWDKLLNLKLFPAEVAKKELAYYKTKLEPYGLPLDNRENYTKTDWEVWTATLADNRADFDALMAPVYEFVNCTQPRVPLTDWYFARDAKMRGFQARPVIGGVFIKMLDDAETWKPRNN